jgi:RNA polymerase sigma factor (sigma-70 family)
MRNCDAEEELLKLAVAGDEVALERLLFGAYAELERYTTAKIPANARRHLGADDIAQDVFAQAFRDIRSCTSTTAAAFGAWLKSIADHRLADALRGLTRKKRGGDRQRLSSADFANSSSMAALLEILAAESRLPEHSVVRREAETALNVALALLPADQRDVIGAHFLRHETIEEIAQRTERTTAAVRGLVHRGKKNLAEAMGRSSLWLGSR